MALNYYLRVSKEKMLTTKNKARLNLIAILLRKNDLQTPNYEMYKKCPKLSPLVYAKIYRHIYYYGKHLYIISRTCWEYEMVAKWRLPFIWINSDWSTLILLFWYAKVSLLISFSKYAVAASVKLIFINNEIAARTD